MQQGQDDQEKQEFISWLADQLQAKTHEDLQDKLKKMGPEGIKQAYQKFQQTKQESSQSDEATESQSPSSMKSGGKLDYIKCLQAFKKGGMVEAQKCGCGSKLKKGGKAKTMQDGGNTTAADNTDSLKKGGMMKGKQVGMKQFGGNITAMNSGKDPNKPLSITNPLLVEKKDGSIGQWGNDLPDNKDPKQYILNKSEVGLNSISQEQMDHLRKHVPNLDSLIGGGYTKPGEVTRFAPDQSDVIRQLLQKFPMQQANSLKDIQAKQILPPNSISTIAMNKKGGSINNPAKSGHYTVPVSKAGSRMSKVDGDTFHEDGNPKPKGTGMLPKWAKKAVKGSKKPKSNDFPQAHNKGKQTNKE